MARFHGVVGFGEAVEKKPEESPGVYEDVVTERSYFGDVVRDTRRLEGGENQNFDLNVSNSISIVADAHAMNHIYAIRYVVWQGARWIVNDVEVRHPRLLLRIGGVYNGPIPEATP